MTTTTPTTDGALLRVKLSNLVDDLDDRLCDDDTDRQYLLETVLDRLYEWAHNVTLGGKPRDVEAAAESTMDLPQCCGDFMAEVEPSVSIFPGEQAHIQRRFRCLACGRWHRIDVTDPDEKDRIFAEVAL